ncbi:MAG: type 4a pilus biogenesis protein PilO [Actinomycetota bacterium]
MRRWVILGLLVAVFLTVAWWLFFISPRNARVAEARGDLETARDREMALRAQVGQLHAIRDAEVEYLAAIGQLESLIPDRPLLDGFIDDVYALCGTTGVELLSMAPAEPVPKTDSSLRQISVAMTIDGEFFEVLGFLFGVMDMDRLVRVDAVTISSGQDETGATSLSVSLSLRLFTLADLVPVAAAPDAGTGTPGDGSADGEVAPEAQTTIVPSSFPASSPSTIPSTIPSTTVPSGEG